MNEDISGILKHWEDKQIHSSVLKKKYNECAEKYKNLDKTFRSAISLCSLVAAYTITFQKSDNDQKISNRVYHLEILFSFGAAVISVISQIINIPQLIEIYEKNSQSFDTENQRIQENITLCNWLNDNTSNVDAQSLIGHLKDQIHFYNISWSRLNHEKTCCCSRCFDIKVDTAN